jgi:hypothetical protein
MYHPKRHSPKRVHEKMPNVPACAKCNSRWQIEGEYFRDFLLVGPLATCQHPDLEEIRGNYNRARERDGKAGRKSLFVGSSLSGSFTIDFGAATVSGGTIGQTNGSWYQQTLGGSSYSLPTPNALVFSSTLQTGGYTFFSSVPSTFFSNSVVVGNSQVGNVSWQGQDFETSSSNSTLWSTVTFLNSGSTLTYDANGLPILANATSQSNQLIYEVNGAQAGDLVYTITSLTPVPLPASAWLMLSSIFGLGVKARRRAA